MIQDIAPYVFDNQYYPEPPTSKSYVLLYDENKVLLKLNEDGSFDLPTFGDLVDENSEIYKKATYLFSIDDMTFYLVDQLTSNKDYEFKSVRNMLRCMPKYFSFAVLTGYQLYNWYRNRKYCGRCGALFIKSENTRILECPECGQIEYPNIAPAVIIGVTKGDSLLLAEYPNYEKYAMLAGFSEIGESLEGTVIRETMEEVGLKVKNIRYYKSQPWSLADNLLTGFFCELDGPDEITLDKEELSSAAWVKKEDIPFDESYDDGSLTSEMMGYFKNNP